MRYSYVPESEAAHAARIRPWLTSERVIVPPPLVPARQPLGPHEFADKRAAAPFGRLAIGLGWRVLPWYWRAHNGTETCCLQLARGPLRAVATWERQLGAEAWASGVAYAWNTDLRTMPVNVGLRRLTALIREVGRGDE
jgi:hypothetical protein